MNYELAKQLKYARFPHEHEEITNPGDESTDCFYRYLDYRADDKEVCFPPLSEIIEACGDDITCLSKYESGWSAEHKHVVFGSGSTPEEAVAKLWLALNTKQ